ncbi:MAG: hypothetical protein FJ382_10245 [Verrucomicrobia bacterium]|nr:hypothetical protein [Verrucomicrobiota bacterium]
MKRPPEAASRRRTKILLLGLSGCVFVAVVLFAGGPLAGGLTRLLLPRVISEARAGGWVVRTVTFRDADLRPWATLRWSDVEAEILPPPPRRSASPHGPPIRVRATGIEAGLAGLFPPRVDLSVQGIRINSAIRVAGPEDTPFASADLDVPVERVDRGSFELPDVPLGFRPRTIVRREVEAMHALLIEGSVARPVTFGARLHFHLRGSAHELRLQSEWSEGRTWLRIHRGDLDTLSARYYRPLTPTERDLLARHPVRAPVLLRIKDYAERAARRLAASDPVYVEDSTRHVLWSYWLARTFDADFAREVGEAHEIGSDNSAEESARDRANNALGRDFAADGKTEGQVVNLIRKDPRLVRAAQPSLLRAPQPSGPPRR